MLVWQKLWLYISDTIHCIFSASLELGHHLTAWRTAAIVVLKKPQKPDKTTPNAYRPISLLNTLGKLLEAVVARRLSFYAEEHNLLPDTQFGGRSGRSAEQALLVLVDAIWTAWRQQKVLTLVSFDLKGAFNGVNNTVLDKCLQQRRIPDKMRSWIQSFMTTRKASVILDGYTKPETNLEYPGIPQGSPLSPILFGFFNANLVEQPVDFLGGASAYIDDYLRWRIGPSAQRNLSKLQREDIPRIERWAKQTGACFEPSKTDLIHFSRDKTQHCPATLTMSNHEVKPKETTKLLGVVFNQELRWKPHVQRAIYRATKTCLAIGRLYHLRPKQMRQLYQACVIPQMDYASTVWHSFKGCKWQVSVLSKVQRLATIKTISAFKTVATDTLDTETFLMPTKLRLQHRAARVITGLQALPDTHPTHRVLQRTLRNLNQTNNFLSPLHSMLKVLNTDQLNETETISTCPPPPWRRSPFVSITSRTTREEATKVVNQANAETPTSVIYTDAASKKGNLGAAAVIIDQHQQVQSSAAVGVGSSKHFSVHAAEMVAIHSGIHLAADQHLQRHAREPHVYTVASDSKTALQAISKPARRASGQHIVRTIHAAAQFYQESLNIQFKLQWIPSHSKISGNETADKLAKQATSHLREHDFKSLLTSRRQTLQQETLKQWRTEWRTSTKGQHARRIDAATPGPHVRHLYDNLPRNRANLLAQLRTGHCWLKSYRMKIGYIDDDKCECGEPETVEHVLMECPLLQPLRSKLHEKIGDKSKNLSLMLGGRPPTQSPLPVLGTDSNTRSEPGNEDRRVTASNSKDRWNITSTELNAVLDFAEDSQRFTRKEDAEI
jgi:ribonuclease HI